MGNQSQRSVEAEMAQLGIERYARKRRVAESKSIETTTPAGQWLLANAITPLADALEDWKKLAHSRPGREHKAVAYYDQIDTYLAAGLIARTVLDAISRARKMTRASMIVAGILEDEVRFQTVAASDKGLWRELYNRVKEFGSYTTKRRHIVHAMNKVGHSFQPWPQANKLSVGVVAIDLMEKATGLIEIQSRMTMFGWRRTEIVATKLAMQWLRDCHARSEFLTPVYLPCTEVPKDWRNPLDGGFHTPELYKRALVKTSDQRYIDELMDWDMPKVYQAVNIIQATGFTPDTKVAEVMRHFWENNIAAGGLPIREDIDVPPKPHDIDTNAVARKAWRRGAAAIHDKNAHSKGERIAMAKVLHLADKYDGEALWFVAQLDFRGRVYPTAYHLHPQGPDYVRSLLLFSEGGPVVTEDAKKWFMVHGANAWGLSKKTFDKRIQWVNDNQFMIMECAVDPYANRSWEEADSPWSFLQWCFQYVTWRDQGDDYICHLPIPQDATQSGVQIMSLMLRDEVGAQATNCIHSEEPQDLYGAVADAVNDILKTRPDDPIAQMWLDMNLDRVAMKRVVMVRGYNGGLYSALRYVREWVNDHGGLPINDDFSACYYLAKVIWEAMDVVIGGSQRTMDWLGKVSDICVSHGLPVRWTSPVGFPVKQAYTKSKLRCIKTMIGDTLRKHGLRESTGELDLRKMRNGLAPNFVHSLDAAALMETVVISQGRGVFNFAMVHDSFATTPDLSEELAISIREAYVKIFSQDVLRDFKKEVECYLPDGVELPPLPEYGDLNPADVLDSPYFFN